MKKWLKVKHSEFLLNKNAAKPDGTPNQWLKLGLSRRMHRAKLDTKFE